MNRTIILGAVESRLVLQVRFYAVDCNLLMLLRLKYNFVIRLVMKLLIDIGGM